MFLPLLWVSVEPAAQSASDLHTVVLSGIWRKKNKRKQVLRGPAPVTVGQAWRRGCEARGSSQEAAYLRTEALGLVQGDDHVGHDEEGVFLLQSGQRGENAAVLLLEEPSEVTKKPRCSFSRTVPFTSPTCHAEKNEKN